MYIRDVKKQPTGETRSTLQCKLHLVLKTMAEQPDHEIVNAQSTQGCKTTDGLAPG